MEGSLCTKCQTFVGDMSRMVEVAKEAFDAPTHQHHEFLFCLKEAAANGCFLCLLFMYQRETLLEEKEHSPKAILINDVAWTKAFLSLGIPRKHPELPWILSLWPTFSPILSRCFEEQPLILELHQLDSSSQPSTYSLLILRLVILLDNKLYLVDCKANMIFLNQLCLLNHRQVLFLLSVS